MKRRKELKSSRLLQTTWRTTSCAKTRPATPAMTILCRQPSPVVSYLSRNNNTKSKTTSLKPWVSFSISFRKLSAVVAFFRPIKNPEARLVRVPRKLHIGVDAWIPAKLLHSWLLLARNGPKLLLTVHCTAHYFASQSLSYCFALC